MQTRLFSFVLVAASACLLVGSGESRDRVERDKQRLQAEEQAQREIQKSNQAVNEVSKKLGRKSPTLDLGVPLQTQTVPASPPPATPPKP